MTVPTTTPLDQATEAAAGLGLELVRAVPRDDSLLVTVVTADGQEVAGRWVDRRLDLHHHGRDRRLPALAGLLAGGATLVAHRSGRRAVVRHADGSRWTKIVPRRRIGPLVDGLHRAGGWPGVQVPPVLAHDRDAGTVTLGTLPGDTLHDLLGAARPGPRLATLGARVGAALARLHAVPATDDLPRHDLAAEVELTGRWLDRAASMAGLAAPADLSGVSGHRSTADVVLHRDLHDKQMLLDDAAVGHGVGLLDLDLMARGEAALDLANLLVHLELRVRQGLLDATALAPLAESVLAAYGPSDDVESGLSRYARLARLRLAGVHAFRPADAAAAVLLTTHPLLDT